jgi:hypothetical protein
MNEVLTKDKWGGGEITKRGACAGRQGKGKGWNSGFSVFSVQPKETKRQSNFTFLYDWLRNKKVFGKSALPARDGDSNYAL